MSFEPYILFSAAISIILALLLFYSSWKKFEILIFLFPLSTWVASIFYDNVEKWLAEEAATSPGGYLRGAILLFVGIMGIIKFIRLYPIHKGKIPVHLFLLFIFLLYSFASLFYSIDFKTTLIRTSLFTALAFFLLGLNSWLDSEKKLDKMMNTLFYLVTFLIFIDVAVMFVWPERVWWWKTSSRFIGLWSHPNELGGLHLISYPIILWKFYKEKSNNRYFALLVLIISLIFHFLTGSRTSLIASMFGITIWLALQKSWLKLGMLFIFLAFGIIIISKFSIASFKRDEGSKITDISERDHIWNGAIIFAKDKPVLGYGYAVESKIFANQKKYDLEGLNINNNSQQPLHNGYLSIFIGGGSIGLLLWLILLLSPLFVAFTSGFSYYKLYVITTIIPILISNFVESAITGYLSASDIFFWLAWVVAGKLYILQEQKEKTTQKHIFKQKEVLQNA